MSEEEEYPGCNDTGRCETETGSKNDLDMCKYCGALMIWNENKEYWQHYSLFK